MAPSNNQNPAQMEASPLVMSRGSIVRIKIENLRSIVNHEFYPAPGVNIIHGNDCVGKTSLLVGISLGLGGGPGVACSNVNGSICSQIRPGCPSATIEIELANSPSNYVIRRTIRRDVDSSLWELNGVPVEKQQIRSKMRDLNIQFDEDNDLKFAKRRKGPEKFLLDSKKLMDMTLEVFDNSGELVGQKNEIRGLEEEIRNLEGAAPVENEDVNEERIQLKKSQLEDVKASLLADLAPLIGRMNRKFEKWMNDIQKEGKIFVETGMDGDGFTTFSLVITVTFDTSYAPVKLQSFRFSHTEKYLTGLFFLLAIHDCAFKAPFRFLQDLHSVNFQDIPDSDAMFLNILDSLGSPQYFITRPNLESENLPTLSAKMNTANVNFHCLPSTLN